mgnify:CR=1 FL=1
MADEVAHSMEYWMLQAGKDILPNMRMTAEPCLMRRWSKGAEPTFDNNGKLIPWDDVHNA